MQKGVIIIDVPISERPRERFKKYGINSLSNIELLSILLRTGNKNSSVLNLSTNLLKKYDIHDFNKLDYNLLKKEYGIGEVKAITLLCAIEFGKRVYSNQDKIVKINTSIDAYYYVKDDLSLLQQEEFLVIYLNAKNEIIKKIMLFKGTINSSHVYARDIFREALQCNAYSMILAHNHPSGSPEPSMEDIYLTTSIIKQGIMLQLYILDHIIIGKNSYYSFKDCKPDIFKR